VVDVFNAVKRSEIMSRIRYKNTRAELIVFAHLRKHKIYFQKHYDRVPGKPDIALPRKKLAVFIDGDFWHGRTFERLRRSRNDPDDYWVKKIARNMQRDIEQQDALLQAGWKILRVWESDIMRKRTSEEALSLIVDFLQEST
jgi:DNA mismatch endonuclease (patch repair protein)